MGGWVEKLPSGKYRAVYRAPDRTRVTSKPMLLQRDAKEWLADQLGDIAQGRWVDPRHGRTPLIEWLDEWAAAQDQWKRSSRGNWLAARKRIEGRAGGTPIGAVDLMGLLRLRADLAETFGPRTVAQTMSYVGAGLRAAYASGRIGRDPTVGLKARRARVGEPGVRVTPDMVPTRAEALAVLAATKPEWRAGVALGLAGLRISEMLGLTADRIDLADRQVTVDRQADQRGGWTTPKNERARTIEVPGVVAVELRRHMRDRDDGILFAGVRTDGTRTMSRSWWHSMAWAPALRAAGLEGRFKFHSLRHWCASTMLAEGAPVTAVAGHLGDTVVTVSRTYAHWLRDDRGVPAGLLDRALAKQTGENDEETGT